MHLKKIEIIGFKSFADKTTLTFEPGVTGVVGPNGSGKSNITEAIRWVLGETSAKSLRGGKMPDIIFAGTQKRRGVNIAEVTVLLNNEDHYLPLDYNEIAIKRSLNRNGDSDYFINQKRARLRDIQELFMDSGLGKESFSIISQGKVEEIFNSKPEDRRGIFEEAAGVFKYKQKKKAAEQKLFETSDNLNRVEDILFELKEQLTPLAHEKSQAEKYLALKEDLTQVEVAVTAEKISRFSGDFKKTQETLKEVTIKLQEVSGILTLEEEKLAEKKRQFQKTDEVLNQAQAQQLVLTQVFEQAQSKKQLLAEKFQNQGEKKEAKKTELAHLELEINQLAKRLQEETKKVLSQQSQLDNLEDLVATQEKLVARYSRSVKEQLSDLRSDFIDVMQQETNVLNDEKHNQRLSEQVQQQQVNRQEKIQALKSQQEALQKSLNQLVERKTAAEEKLTRLVGILEGKQKNLDGLQENYHNLQQSYYQKLGSLQQKQARLKSLQEIAESHGSYYQGVRGILRNPQLKGIIGPVAELLTLPQAFTRAIETALSGTMQFIVVEDEQAAKGAIDFLKRQNLGRATFLPLTTIKEKKIPDYLKTQLAENPKFLGVASEVVSYDLRYTAIFKNLLGTTLLAKDLTGAIEIAKKVAHQYKVVSLEGDIMNAGGSMAGGSFKNNQGGLLAQKVQQETLQLEVTALESLVKKEEEEVLASQQSQEKLKADLQTLRIQEERGRKFIQEITSQIQDQEKDFSQQEKEKLLLTRELEDLTLQLSELAVEKKQLTEESQTFQGKKEKIQATMNELEKTGSSNETLKNQAQEKLQDVLKQQAVLEESQHHLRTSITEKEERLKALQATQEKLVSDIAFLETETQGLSSEALEKTLTETKEKQEKLSQEISQLQAKKSQLLEIQGTKEAAIKGLQEKQQDFLQQKATNEGEKSRLETQLDNYLQFLQEEYALTFERAQADFPLTQELALAEKTVKTLKGELQSLGPVNLGAIEQYQQVSQRYDFLNQQKEDLLQAKDHLFATMDEMDEEVKNRFSETFTKISNQFQVVFPKMFGGGVAELRLTDPKDLLHTGIEIVAQPPGKKLQNLNLLSGGERALTAITLLFAILQVRPVPFTVLDEVEAALDEANVTRFGRFLQSFEEERQFIVVTHRKGTMEACDVLYGVTMEESGVSKVLSVQLKDVKETGQVKGN